MPTDFFKLKQEIEDNTSKTERAKGALQRVEEELKDEFGYETPEEAEESLKELEEEIAVLKGDIKEMEEELAEELEEIDGSD